MDKTLSTFFLFITILFILLGSGGALLWIPALYYGFESMIGAEMRAWWKGVKFRAKVNREYKERAQAFEQRIKRDDSWQH